MSLISILIPTRKRVNLLNDSIKSIVQTVSDINNVELCFRFDEDDEETSKYFEENKSDHYKFVIKKRPSRGYDDLHHLYNDLMEVATGKLIFIFNDDVFINTINWDLKLEPYKNRPVIIRPHAVSRLHKVSNLFPIVHRKFYDLTGVLGVNRSIDVQYERLTWAYPRLLVPMESIVIQQNTNYPTPIQEISNGGGLIYDPTITYDTFKDIVEVNIFNRNLYDI